jgi:hypothetical protein
MRDENMQPGDGLRDRRSNGAAALKSQRTGLKSPAPKSGPLDDETRDVFHLLMAECRHGMAEPESVKAQAAEMPEEISGSIFGVAVAFGFGALAARLLSR